MTTLRSVVAAGLLCAAIASAPAEVRAQDRLAPTGFDGYRALAITAGAVAGIVVAAVITDGLIIPVYAWATGGSGAMAGGGMGAGLGAGMGAGAGEGMMMGGAGGYGLLRGGARLFGAVAGGLFGDQLYVGK